jgi:hypothetical protein
MKIPDGEVNRWQADLFRVYPDIPVGLVVFFSSSSGW